MAAIWRGGPTEPANLPGCFHYLTAASLLEWASQVALVGENPPVNAGDAGSIPGLGKPLVEDTAIHSSVLAWRSLWMEEPGGLWSIGSQSGS